MTAQKKQKLGQWVTIAGLALTALGAATGYGRLNQQVDELDCRTHNIDARSISNGQAVSGIDGKLDMIIMTLERMQK